MSNLDRQILFFKWTCLHFFKSVKVSIGEARSDAIIWVRSICTPSNGCKKLHEEYDGIKKEKEKNEQEPNKPSTL